MRNIVKKQSGITLIALVVTIIVLIILAGVSIAMLVGDNGIITQAQRAKENTELAEKQEKEDIGKLEDEMNEDITGIKVEQVTDENPGVLEGTGPESDPYTINSIEDLVVFANNVTNGATYEGQTVKLGLSLDFNSNKSYVNPYRTDYIEYGYDGELKTLLTSGEGFKPIGTTYDANISTNYFKGTFDGDYNTIYNLYQDIENSEYVTIAGLFSTNGGIIKKLEIENAKIYGQTNNFHLLVGGIAGRNSEGTIEQCSTSGEIILQANGVKTIYAGGIVGQSISSTSEVTINQCNSKIKINVNSTNTNNLNIAGIGQSNITKNCYFSGEIYVIGENSGTKNIEGIGNATQSIVNCYNVGKIQSYFDNENSGDLYISGIAGNSQTPEINNCYNLGDINCKNPKVRIAGIEVNAQNGEINNCHNIGKLNASGNLVIIGALTASTESQTINNSKWLSGSADKAIGNETTNVTKNNIEEISNIEDMPSVLSIVNSENCFKEDTNNINNGYPILNWQSN